MKKLFFIFLLLASCSAGADTTVSFGTESDFVSIEPSLNSSKSYGGESEVFQGEYIIKYAYATMDVSSNNFETKKEEYIDLIKLYEGTITSIYESTNYQGLRQINIVSDIPSGKFDNFITDIESIKKLTNININSNDVSVQVLDINSRISSLEKEQASLNEIKKDANTTSEKLEVQSQLRYINEQLEILVNQKEYYLNSVSYSEVSMSIREGSGISLFSWNYYVQRALSWLEGLIGLLVSGAIFILPLYLVYFIYRKYLKKDE